MYFSKISAILIFSSSLVFATSTEDFFYQRGYENGYVSGYERGVQEAFKEAKAMLSKYSDSLKSYEIGKYLIKNQNLTYPQVWQEVGRDGVLKLRVLPSEITKEINASQKDCLSIRIPFPYSAAVFRKLSFDFEIAS